MPEVHHSSASMTDEEVVARLRAEGPAYFEEIMRRHNQRLYRVARAILRDEHEAEDAMQQAYIHAYLHLDQFSGRSRLATWLTRIVINEALGRRRRSRLETASGEPKEAAMAHATSGLPDPERQAYTSELRALLESSIDALPEGYRLVFMCREVEGLSTAETADALEVGEEAVKTRLHRARAMLRRELYTRAGSASVEAFAFHRSRCDAMVQRVLDHLKSASLEGSAGSGPHWPRPH